MHHIMQEGQCSALPNTFLGDPHMLLHADGAAAYAIMCGFQANLLTMPTTVHGPSNNLQSRYLAPHFTPSRKALSSSSSLCLPQGEQEKSPGLTDSAATQLEQPNAHARLLICRRALAWACARPVRTIRKCMALRTASGT